MTKGNFTNNKCGGLPPSRKLFKQFDESGTEDLDQWRAVFVEMSDPTEYEAAIVLAGSWENWNRMKQLWPHFRNVILPAWLEEVEIKLRSAAIRDMCGFAKSKAGTAAARWIAEGKYNPRRAGKPSKAEVEKEARIAAGVTDEVEDDISRVVDFKERSDG